MSVSIHKLAPLSGGTVRCNGDVLRGFSHSLRTIPRTGRANWVPDVVGIDNGQFIVGNIVFMWRGIVFDGDTPFP